MLRSEGQQQRVVVAVQQQAGEGVGCRSTPQLHGAQQEGVEAGEEVTGAESGVVGKTVRRGGKTGTLRGWQEVQSR